MTKLLAGGAALSEPQSPDERKATDYLLWQARLRDYNAWLASLPVSEADRELIRIVDGVRQKLVGGAGIPAATAKALRLWSRKNDSGLKKWGLRFSVDWLHRERGLPLTEAGAFAEAGEKLALPRLSASQVRKIYYGKKLPRKKKARPLP